MNSAAQPYLERAVGVEPTTASLEGWDSTAELRPPCHGFIRSPRTHKGSRSSKLCLVGRQGFEPWKPMATDLQSAPFGHLGTCPKFPAKQFQWKIHIFISHSHDGKRRVG